MNANLKNLLDAVEQIGIAYGVHKAADPHTGWVDYRDAILQAAAEAAKQEITDKANKEINKK